jgi:hypothetical protein
MDGAWCMLEQHETFYLKKKIVWAFYGRDLIGFYRSFLKVILKSRSAARIIEKSRKCNAHAQLWDANSIAVPQSYPASVGSGVDPTRNVDYLGWQAWHRRVTGRSQNILFSLYLIDTKIEYKQKKRYLFFSDPLPDLRPDLEASGYSAFAYMDSFQNSE